MTIGKLFIISAPTGGGKTTLSKALLEDKGIPLSRVITYTTRPRTENEIDGKDYHFVSRDDFIEKEKQGFFLETTVYDNNFYGSPRSIIQETKQGKSFLMVTDRPGALHIKSLVPQAVLIWITVPNGDAIEKRLRARGREESEQALERRIALARQEIATENKQNEFDHHIMNINFKKALKDLKGIILNKQNSKQAYQARDFLPLIVLFFIITLIVAAHQVCYGFDIGEAMRVWMASFFIIFGFFKVINLKGFAQAYSMYDIIAKRYLWYAYAYPFLELSLGAAYLYNGNLLYINLATIVLMLVSAAGVLKQLLKKKKITCACLGVVFKVPMTYVTLLEDLLMASMALLMLI